MTTPTYPTRSDVDEQRFPQVEFKILEIAKHLSRVRVGFRIVGSTGDWSESTWLSTDSIVAVRWPDGFTWTPPSDVIQLLYPEKIAKVT